MLLALGLNQTGDQPVDVLNAWLDNLQLGEPLVSAAPLLA